eukprot:1940239-Pyramimonas_sp.AAC.1
MWYHKEPADSFWSAGIPPSPLAESFESHKYPNHAPLATPRARVNSTTKKPSASSVLLMLRIGAHALRHLKYLFRTRSTCWPTSEHAQNPNPPAL